MHPKQPSVVPNRRVVEELQVFLRAMSSAQRHWRKQLAQQESAVRRLMIHEDHCREELKRNLLRATHNNLKYLVNTDLLTTAQQAPTPPPTETFLFYDIPAQQVSAFSMYAMSRLWADPDRVDVPPMTLIADLQSAWAILPPAKREAYEHLADIFRAHLDAEYTRRVAAEVAAESAAAKTTAASGTSAGARAVKKQRAAQRIKAARRRAVTAAAAAASAVAPARAAMRKAQPLTPAANTTSTPSPAAALPAWEAAAFDNFVRISHKHMQTVLRTSATGKGNKAKRAALTAAQWLPIAQAEWATKSLRQKRSFVHESKRR